MKKAILSLICLGISASFAQEIPSFGEAILLNGNINTASEEAKPVLNSDGTIMYFVRAFHSENVGYAEHQENEDIWEAIKDENGEWKLAEHEVTINDGKNNSIIGQGKEDHFFLLNTYQDKKHLDYGIAQTRKLSEHNWTKPEVTKIPKLKYDGDFYDFYITHDEQVLIISIKGEDTKGKEDLYVAKSIDGKWSEPINLGDVINTTGFEMSPFLTEDKKYLYYSTDGREDGFGDADVYVTERLDDTWTNWSTPKNLGNIVNSDKMDCYFTMSDNGDYYFASNREGTQGLDLFNVTLVPPMVVLTGKVYNAKDSSLLATNLKMIAQSNNENILASSEMTTYTSTVKMDDTFNLTSEKENFTSVNLSINMANVKVGDTITTDIYMNPIEVVATVEPPLPPLYLREYYTHLMKMFSHLKQN